MITPDWPAPEHVQARITERGEGLSTGPFRSFNLATHVGDDSEIVSRNRQRLAETTGVQHWQWLEQVHGTAVVEAQASGRLVTADGSYTRNPYLALAVLTADCLPLLFCDQSGTQVAAVHAGWRGMANGIIGNAVKQFGNPQEVMVYLGPAISQPVFEVGPEVYAAFQALGLCYQQDWRGAFLPSAAKGRYFADLYDLARRHLMALGVTQIFGGEYCTYSQPDRFYSFRRQAITGRFASAIWLQA